MGTAGRAIAAVRTVNARQRAGVNDARGIPVIGLWRKTLRGRKLQFEWDPRKAAENRLKHGVPFQEAATVFDDPLAITYPDPDHSEGESRRLTFGASAEERLLVVAHTESGDTIRIISARRATRNERKIHEEG